MKQHARSSNRLRKFIAIIAIFAGMISTVFWVLNHPRVLSAVLTISNINSDWKIDIEEFRLSPLDNLITMGGITFHSPQKNKRIHIAEAYWKYSPLGILRGKIVFNKMRLDGVDV